MMAKRDDENSWTESQSVPRTPMHVKAATLLPVPFPEKTYRFIAVDVETASYQSGSICQIGLALAKYDGTITTHSIYVDPQTPFAPSNTRLHGISAETVRGYPRFSEILPCLREAMENHPLVQHSRFDERAFDAACHHANIPTLKSQWFDSVKIARSAWPEFKGNGGHGLSHLKKALNLSFKHHDAGEDARAAAQVVLRAEDVLGKRISGLDGSRQLTFKF